MSVFARRLKVSKTDAFELDVSAWLDGESLTSFTLTNPNNLVTIGATSTAGGVMSCLLTGVTEGVAELHFEYATSTRSDCYVGRVVVVEDC